MGDVEHSYNYIELLCVLYFCISGHNTDLTMSAVTLIEDIIDSEITGEIYYRVKSGICYIRCRIITPSAFARKTCLFVVGCLNLP